MGVEDHLKSIERCFDFPAIKKLLARDDFTMTYDCMSGVQGPYARGIVDKPKAEEMMKMMADKSGTLVGQEFGGMKMAQNDMFEYTDPVDGSVSKNQGIRFIFEDK